MIVEATGRAGQVTCRCTHVYPDGPAPYFTFHAVGRHGELSAQWHTIKSAGLDAVIANGGTVTHHHAIGRDHRQWYDRQRPPLFAAEPTLYAVLQVPFSQWQAGGSKFFIEIFQAVGVTAA